METDFIFFAPFFKTVSNGPAKFANIVHRNMVNEQIGMVVTEDGVEGVERLTPLSPKPRWVKTTVLHQLYRNVAYFRYARKIKPPITFVFNNIVSGCLTAIFFPKNTIGFINDTNKISKISTNLTTIQRIGLLILRRLEMFSAKRCGAIICNSFFLANLIHEIYHIPRNKIHVLYKGTATIENPPAPRIIHPKDNLQLLFVKTDFQRGGLIELVKAIDLLAKERKVTLTVIGTTKKVFNIKTGQQYASLVDKHIFLGKQPQQIVQEKMIAAHIFCSPTYSEALGVANMEAMQLNLPVVTSNVDGIPEVTDNGKNCWVVEAGNVASIAQGIRDCYENPERTREKVVAARCFVAANFSANRAYGRLIEIVELSRDEFFKTQHI